MPPLEELAEFGLVLKECERLIISASKPLWSAKEAIGQGALPSNEVIEDLAEDVFEQNSYAGSESQRYVTAAYVADELLSHWRPEAETTILQYFIWHSVFQIDDDHSAIRTKVKLEYI